MPAASSRSRSPGLFKRARPQTSCARRDEAARQRKGDLPARARQQDPLRHLMTSPLAAARYRNLRYGPYRICSRIVGPPCEELPWTSSSAAEEKAFAAEVERFLDEHATPDVADVTRENMAQIVDTPARRAFMKKLSQRGWLGMTWPKAYGGQEKPGVYEYILNEALARRGCPQIGKGVGIIGKTLIRHGSREAEAGVPAADHPRRDRVRGRLQRAAGRLRRRQHAAPRRARRRRLALQRPEDLDHLGALRRLVLGRRAHRPATKPSTTASRSS